MSVQLLQQLLQAQKASPTVDPVKAIRDQRNIPAAYQLRRPQSVNAPQDTTSMTRLAQMMGNNRAPTGYFQSPPAQRWQPSESPMQGLNAGSWLQNYLSKMNGQ